MPLRLRHTYAAGIQCGLPTGDTNRPRSSPHQRGEGARRCPAQIRQVRAGGLLLRSVHTLVHCRYTVLSCLPNPSHLTVLERPGVVRAACHPPRRPPGQAALSFHRPAATSRWWCPFITTRFKAPRGAPRPNTTTGSAATAPSPATPYASNAAHAARRPGRDRGGRGPGPR